MQGGPFGAIILVIIDSHKPPTRQASGPRPLTTRDRLLDAAAAVIAREGYHRARLVDVAREAGLTTGAVYSNFRDKEELFLASVDRIQRLNDLSVDAMPQGLDQVVAGYRQAAAHFEESSELQVLTFELALLAIRNSRVRAQVEEGMRESVAAMARALRGGKPATEPGTADEIPAESMADAALIIAFGNGLALLRMFAPELASPELVEEAMRRLATASME